MREMGGREVGEDIGGYIGPVSYRRLRQVAAEGSSNDTIDDNII